MVTFGTYFIFSILLTFYIIISSYKTSHMLNNNYFKSEESLELANYEYPKKFGSENTENIITVAILGTNDIHGAAYERFENYKNQKYSVGGYKLLSGIIDNFRKEYKDNFLWLDAGDKFTGTYENTLTNGNLMTDFYNAMELDLAALGNHEWDNGENWLREKIKEEKFFTAAANLSPKSGVDDLSKRLSYKIIELKSSSIKVGIIGLTTIETMHTTAFPPTNFNIQEYLTIIKRYSKELRLKGADAVLILSHVGILCEGTDKAELHQLRIRDKSYKGKCQRGELLELLPLLDKDEVDGVIAGHVHSNVHHFINHIPVIQTEMSNIFTNVLYLQFDKITKKILDRLIEGPIPICSHVYSSNKRCDIKPRYGNLFEDSPIKLVKFTLHSMNFAPNSKVVNLFKGEFNDIISNLQRDFIAQTEIILRRNKNEDNFLRNLVSDIVRDEMKTDLAIVNNGSLRAVWDVGDISMYDVYKMFPFVNNHLAAVSVDGANLKKIVRTLQEGDKGFYSFSGLTIEIEFENIKKKLKSVRVANGDEIDDLKEYTVSSIDFLLEGGDDWSLVKKFFTLPSNYKKSEKKLIDVVIKYLKRQKVISPDSLAVNNRLQISRNNFQFLI